MLRFEVNALSMFWKIIKSKKFTTNDWIKNTKPPAWPVKWVSSKAIML